ncbi:MAG: hypothetical protein HY912_03150 [Desulfomonile tiedjei]|uniref:Methionine synthase n=1 Tax=Desulfomonile tiedjei TaxID=2358 RepID=A0A9D6V0J3_9BACT|nr:hypothetical protein [Desulfomonile tiedjei]
MMKSYSETECLPRVLVTAVGSLPHKDPDAAVDLIMESLPVGPHCPQLSMADPREQMWIQCTEGLPRFRVDLQELSYFFDTSGDYTPDVERFYHEYLAVTEGADPDAFAIGSEYGKGIHAFFSRVQASGKRFPFIKVQVTGPLSFALTVTDQDKKPIFYDPVFRDVAVKGMGLKAAWLLKTFKPFADKVIVFFDEPSLSAYGSSAYLGVSKADVIESLDDVMSMVIDAGGIPGVHCCGNTDWGLLMETSARIVNFDGVDFTESLSIYAQDLMAFLDRGGVLAWGAVPNTAKAAEDSVQLVAERIASGIRLLEKVIDRDLLTKKIIVTPACGCAGLSLAHAEAVYGLLSGFHEKFGGKRFQVT